MNDANADSLTAGRLYNFSLTLGAERGAAFRALPQAEQLKIAALDGAALTAAIAAIGKPKPDAKAPAKETKTNA